MIELSHPPLIGFEKPAIIRAADARPEKAMPWDFFYVGGVPDVIIGTPGTYVNGSASASYTATGLPAISSDARGLIGLALRRTGGTTVTSCTIGGQAASLVHSYQRADGSTRASFYLGPLGASGNVVFTTAASMLRIGVCVWPVKNLLHTTASDTGEAEGTTLSSTVSALAGGAAFSICANQEDTVGYTWTGLTESFDIVLPSNNRFSGASNVFTMAQSVNAVADTSENISVMVTISMR